MSMFAEKICSLTCDSDLQPNNCKESKKRKQHTWPCAAVLSTVHVSHLSTETCVIFEHRITGVTHVSIDGHAIRKCYSCSDKQRRLNNKNDIIVDYLSQVHSLLSWGKARFGTWDFTSFVHLARSNQHRKWLIKRGSAWTPHLSNHSSKIEIFLHQL